MEDRSGASLAVTSSHCAVYDRVVKRLATSVVLLCVLLGGAFVWYKHALTPVDASVEKRVTVKIPKGSSVKQIAKILEEKEIIRSRLAFMTYVRLQGLSASLQAGSFIMKQNQGVPEIVEGLHAGIGEEGVITIPEGFTVKDIDALLAEKGVIEAGEITTCAQTCDFSTFDFLPSVKGLAARGGKLEGYLFPETYFIDADEFVPKFFLERMLGTFRNRIVDGLADDLKKSKRSLHEIVTMASLIEEETRREDERPTVSGILWKRFDAGAGMGVDAAVRYILEKQTGALTVKDLNDGSPYNLRKFRGLPPGPIASPSLSTMRAALNPKESPYWYYLHGTDGQIHYAETNEEHNTNKYLYIQ